MKTFFIIMITMNALSALLKLLLVGSSMEYPRSASYKRWEDALSMVANSCIAYWAFRLMQGM